MAVEWWSVLPFVLLLACIAVFPLVPATARAWEHNTVKLAVALLLGLPIATWFTAAGAGIEVLHAVVEYGQFITLLLALFVVSGGIFLTGDIRATPRNNTIFLAVGGLLASFIGTTGAAMLLIRPILNTNRERAHRMHTVVFTIFVVANCGGLLTPLGDPPLFLGMLRGVPFEWTFGLWPQWLFVNAMLLVTYYALDRRAYARETLEAIRWDDTALTRLGLRGGMNLLFLILIIAAVAFLPSLDLHAIEAGDATLAQVIPWRELAMLGAAAASYLLGDKVVRFEYNEFTWQPILEVAALFIGIFLTMIPALNYLAQIAPTLPLGEVTLFLFSAGLSSVLDNAPTYATFFEMAAQLPGDARVAGVPEALLASVSLGSVLGGAMTYIGNGPNFMTKSVAEAAGVRMPSFGGYLRWSGMFLAPVLIAMVLIFVADGLHWALLGIALTIALLTRAVWLAARHGDPDKRSLAADTPGDGA